MDYVYICRGGENEELRYSIRSLIKFAKDPNIIIFGQGPDWYGGQRAIVDPQGSKYKNARANLKALIESDLVSEEFVLMNDDFYLMREIDDEPPIWNGGPLFEKILIRKKMHPFASYTNLLLETYRSIQTLGIKEPLDYELHTPLKMTKTGLAEAMQYPGLWRSIYGNLNNIGGERHNDVKIYADPDRSLDKEFVVTLYLSSDDESFESVKNKYLKYLFLKPSEYELDQS